MTAQTLAWLNWITNTDTGGLTTLPHSQEGRKMKVDYIAIAQEYYAGRNDGFITDLPQSIQLEDDDYVRMRYDRKAMRLMPSRPSRITYPTARKLINQYRKKYAEKWG